MLRLVSFRAATTAAALTLSTLCLFGAAASPAHAGSGESVLYAFSQYGAAGTNPYASPTLGPDGDYYGTNVDSGSGGGTVYKFDESGNLALVHAFASGNSTSDGSDPYAGVTFGSDGSLYGTTASGGASGDGIVYKIAPDGTYSILHSFAGGSDGGNPKAGITIGHDGRLYGATDIENYNNANAPSTIFSMNADGTGLSGAVPF